MNARLFRVAAAVVAALVLPAPATALAADATTAEIRSLARRAAEDPNALAELRRIDRVDGMAFDVHRLLDGAQGAEVEERLRVLADESDAAVPSDARGKARAILEQKRFRPAPVPRPFEGLAERVGKALEPVGEWLTRMAARLPGGPVTFWFVIALVVVVVAAAVTSKLVARRGARDVTRQSALELHVRETAASLQRAAEEAAAGGHFADAIRFRFRAGLLRLDAAGVIRFYPGITSREVAGKLRSRTFDDLRMLFDRVVYGGRAAERDDVLRSRDGWRKLEAEVARR